MARGISAADIISFINAFFGFSSILFSINGNYLSASILLVLAVLIDFLDGKVARLLKHRDDFGKEIDSLCDIVSFGVAPAFFFSSMLDGWIKFIPFLLVLGGIFRLARYNISKSEGYYIGMPITMNGILVPLTFAASLTNPIAIIVLSVVLTALMVSRFRVKKWV